MVFKRYIQLFIFLYLFFSFNSFAQNVKNEFVVVGDAGHGGKDPGNLGTGRYGTKEKDIALDVALKLGAYINENMPEVEVVYTRETDVFPKLYERTALANRPKTDLYI